MLSTQQAQGEGVNGIGIPAGVGARRSAGLSRLILLTLAAGLLPGGCSPAGKAPAPALAEHLAQADRLARAGRPRGAAELLEKVRRSSAEGGAQGLPGKIAGYYLASGSNQGALRWAEAALAAPPRDLDALYVKGEASRRLADLETARGALGEVLRISPGHLHANLSMARLKFRASAPAEALSYFKSYFSTVGKDEPEDILATARLEYGRALRATGRHQEAADEFALLIEREPGRSEYYSELSATLYRMRLRKEAKFLEGIYKGLSQGSFEEYGVAKMRTEGREAQALAQQAVNRQRQRRFLDAFDSHRTALEANTGDARIPILYARYCLGFRRINEGLEVISAAINAGCRPLSSLWWEKGRLEAERGNWQAAADAFQSTLQAIGAQQDEGVRQGAAGAQANRFSAFLGLARSRVELGQHGAAAEAIEEARKLSAAAWEPSYWSGRSLLSRGESAAALRAFDEALRLCREGKMELPGDLTAYRAVALGRSGQGEGALEALLAQLEKAPGRVELYPEVIALCGGDAARKEWAGKRLGEMTANREKIDQLETKLQAVALEGSAGIYVELARAYSVFQQRVAYDCLFLASELDPANTGVLKDLLKIRKSPQEVFFRLRLLRRLLAAEPMNEPALYGIGEIFVKLHVRTGEARALVAEGLRKHPGSERLESLRKQLAGRPEPAGGGD